jgi:RNA polymerase sigma factor (sigma-70 family)
MQPKLEEEGAVEAGRPTVSDAARKRAAVELVASHEQALRRTARRYSLDAEDADDAYQRALEIALTKAPTTDLRELIRWAQTVTKHEALAVREGRERLLGLARRREGADHDPVALIAAPQHGPEEQVERREEIARSREALKTLKPAELRALSLLAEATPTSRSARSPASRRRRSIAFSPRAGRASAAWSRAARTALAAAS